MKSGFLCRARHIATWGTVALGILAPGFGGAATAGLSPAQKLNSYGDRDHSNSQDSRAKVATDGQGNWVGMWINDDNFLEFANSTTSGTSWGVPRVTTLNTGFSRRADLCYTGSGKWVAIWTEPPIVGGDPPGLLTVPATKVSTSADYGQSWSPEVTLYSQPRGHWGQPMEPQIESDGEGNVLATWNSVSFIHAGTWEYYHHHIMTAGSTDGGVTWTTPTEMNLAVPRTDSHNPARIASAGPGRWLMVYGSLVGEDNPGTKLVRYKLAQSTDLGVSWTPLGDLFSAYSKMGSLGNPQFDIVVHGTSGRIVTSYPVQLGYTDSDAIYRRAVFSSSDSGTSFTGPTWLEAEDYQESDGSLSRLATDESGNWVITSVLDYSAPVQVWTSRAGSTTWTLSQTLTDAPIARPAAAGAGNGTFVVMAEHIAKDPAVFIQDVNIRSIASTDAGQTWSSPTFVNDVSKSTNEIFDRSISIASGDTALVASWLAEIKYPPGTTPRTRVMTAFSTDSGRTWSTAQIGESSQNAQDNRTHYVDGSTFEVYWGTKKIVSNDNGQTWSAPLDTSGLPPDPVQNVLPVENGEQVRVGTEIEEVPLSSSFFYKTYMERSYDGGATWQEKSYLHVQTLPRRTGFVYTNAAVPEIRYLGLGRIALLMQNRLNGRDSINYFKEKVDYAFLAESSDNGHTWREAEPVYKIDFNRGPVAASAMNTSFVTTPDANIIIAWPDRLYPDEEYDDDIFYRVKRFGQYSGARDWSLYE